MNEMSIEITSLGKYRKILSKLTLYYEQKNYRDDSVMAEWCRECPDTQKVILLREKNEIVGWGMGKLHLKECWKKYCYYEDTCMVGIYVSKEHRGKGFGNVIGKTLFKEMKAEKFKRILVCMRTNSAKKMYTDLAKYIGAKRCPYKLPFTSSNATYKLIKL